MAGSAQEFTVSDLDPGTTYYFALKTADEVPNWSAISNCSSCTTGIYIFLLKWGSEGSGDGQFEHAWGVAVDNNGYVYVSDTENHRIQKFDSSGSFVTKWGSFGTGNGQFRYPVGIAVDSNNNVYVVDYYNHRVQKFNSNGTFITKWGSYGTGNGQFIYPSGIAVDNNENVYVSDTGNHRIQKFDSSGTFITKWGCYGTDDGEFDSPAGIDADDSNNVYVGDAVNNNIQKFNSSGTFFSKWGSYGSGDGQFNSPGSIAIDNGDNVYIVDAYNHRIQKFNSSGAFITKWGSYGTGDGQFNSPVGIAVDDNGYVYVADVGNCRIQKFGPAIRDLTTSSTSGGSVTTPGEDTYTYDAGQVADLVAAPDAGYDFVSWTGDISTVADAYAASTNITMNGDYAIQANFQEILGAVMFNLIEIIPAIGTPEEGSTENFTYDFLDRLTGVSGPYTENYTYNEIGNIMSRNGVSYTYGAKPHAVTAVGAISYEYDANGNMTVRGGQTITWDAENRPVTVSQNGTITSFVYDGDGNRVKKLVNDGQSIITTIYVNKYFEVTGTEETSYYYLGGLIAQKKGETLTYIHADHLSGTSVMTNSSGSSLGIIKYSPFGITRSLSGTLPTDKLFTGQRKDSTTGLYYFKARYYEPGIGRFLSPDSASPDLTNPQSLNKYSYCFNNPLKYNDPTGNWPNWGKIWGGIKSAFQATVNFVKENIGAIQTGLDVLGMIPVIGEAADAINGIIYAARCDEANAALSFGACIPLVGTIATGAKLTVKVVDKVADVVKGIDNVPSSLLKGEKNVDVYLGMKNGVPDYVGVSNDVSRREMQHGPRFDYLEKITSEQITRNQAKAIEQALIMTNPQFSNIINSISHSNTIYNDAIQWGMDWLKYYGY